MCIFNIGLMKSGRAQWQEEKETRKDFNIVPILQEQFFTSEPILYVRALQGRSGRNLIDLPLQDNVLIPHDFFEYIYHVGFAINLHSIINSGLIPGGKKFEQKTDTILFCLWIPCTKNIKILRQLSTSKFGVLHNTCRQHGRNFKTRCIGSTSDLLKKKGLKFYQTRSNAIILYNTLPAYCIPKAIKMETGEFIYEKVYEVTSAASEDFLGRWLDEGIGFSSCCASRKLPTNPTKPQSNSQNRATCYDRTNVPFECSGNRHTFLTWLREN